MERLRMMVWLGLFLLPGLLACECDGSNLKQGRPLIEVDPNPLGFETLGIGSSQLAVLSVSNVGTAALTIDSIQIEGDSAFSLISVGASLIGEVEFPLGLAQPSAGQSQVDCQIEFFPEELRDYTAELVITSDDENQAELRVSLQGSGSQPDIEADPMRLEFTGVGLNSSGGLTLVIHNRGGAELRIPAGGLGLANGEESSPFILPTSAMNIAAGGQVDVAVAYSPRKLNLDPVTHLQLPDVDVLLVHSNDPDENPLEVGLWGMPDANLPPLVGVRVDQTTMLDGTQIEDPCAVAPSDTIVFGATVIDPEGGAIQSSFLTWSLQDMPDASARSILVNDPFAPTFKPDLSGEYRVCLQAKDAQGEFIKDEDKNTCSCQEANAALGMGCDCVRLQALPREDIRIELTWDVVGPDLDLHLLAPAGEFCTPTLDCRTNPFQPEDPSWTRTACVQIGEASTCRTPSDPATTNCAAVTCPEFQECFDDVNMGAACYWQTCSGSDCFWNARNPDWGVQGDTSDDPLLAIDCTRGCRVENVNLNNPESGIYRVKVNYFEPFIVDTLATVRIFFRGDLDASYEYTSLMTGSCDTWNVAQIDWVDHDNHSVTYEGGAHSSLCCQ